MLDSLPNLHAALVHFPVALLLVAAAVDTVSLARPGPSFLRRAATLLVVLGAGFLVAAYLTGQQAGDQARSPVRGMQRVLGEHQDRATWALSFYLVYALGRLALERLRPSSLDVQVLLLLLGLGGGGLLVATAERGGELVYEMGVGVRPLADRPAPTPPAEEPAGPSPGQAAGWQAGDEFHWIYRSGSETSFARPFEVVGGPLQVTGGDRAVRLVPGSPRRTLLLLPGSHGSVEMRTQVRLEEFHGTFGLVHHLQDPTRFDHASVNGEAWVLGRLEGGSRRDFQRRAGLSRTGWLDLQVVSTGRHLRLYRNDEMVLHAHATPTADGRVGLWLEGTGAVEVRELLVRSLEEERN